MHCQTQLQHCLSAIRRQPARQPEVHAAMRQVVIAMNAMMPFLLDAAPWGPKLWAPSATLLGFSLIGAPHGRGKRAPCPYLAR